MTRVTNIVHVQSLAQNRNIHSILIKHHIKIICRRRGQTATY